MSKKNFILIFFSVLLISCGYSPIYKNLKDLNFSISINQMSGERKINNMIKSNLENYTLNKKDKIYDITMNSNYKKTIIAKDTTGAATEYKLELEVKFIVVANEFNKEFKYTESFNMHNISDKLEERDYEDNIQSSLTNIISRKLILQLSQLK